MKTDAFGVQYSNDYKTLIKFPFSIKGGYSIPDGVEKIDDGAFEECSMLTSIIIPNGVIHIGDSAFFNCTNLSSINLPDSVKEIGDCAFLGTSLMKPLFNKSIFAKMPITYQGHFEIPSGIITIQSDAFANCEELSSIVIPASVRKIQNGAFCGCSGLEVIHCNSFCPPECDNDCFMDVPSNISVCVPEGRINVYKEAKEWNTLFGY